MLSIILPTYNEKDNLPKIIKEILAVFKKNNINGQIIIVDDNSPDGTGKMAEELKRQNEAKIKVIHRAKKLGLGSAYIIGFKRALELGSDYIFEIDADLSHDPKAIPDFLKAIKKADLILGSRYIKGGKILNWGVLRRLISRLGNVYAKTILTLPYSDLTSGYKCFRREVLENIDLENVASIGYCFQIELTYKAYKKGFKVREIPITFTERTKGKSKFSFKIMWETLLKVWWIKKSS